MARITSHAKIVNELKELKTLQRKLRFGAVVTKANTLLKVHPYLVPALVAKARAIQMLEEGELSLGTLDEAKDSLTLAVDLDPAAGGAVNELAYFLFAIWDRSNQALGLFERSLSISLEALRDAHIGRIKCLMDLERWSSCERALKEARRIFPSDLKFTELKEEFRQMTGKRRKTSPTRK